MQPKVAQILARHSDIRLTMQVYTHVELHDQQAAIAALPAPPSMPCAGIEQQILPRSLPGERNDPEQTNDHSGEQGRDRGTTSGHGVVSSMRSRSELGALNLGQR
ncbi:hypothetical protein AYO40_03870 [Planctomycetaceae bacterium SCGC AG-212-D15]|nr:hypothetical protein AYO40_03870 [Planctomycetaceae bacterium SCGC AG-212-D15]